MGTRNKTLDSCKAVSSVVGLLLMYSLAIIAIGIILVYNVPVLNDMQENAKAQKVEQAFTVLDSRISKAALGESPYQTTAISLMGGSVSVNSPGENEKGLMTIQIINYTTNNSEEFNCSLGTIEYIKDDRTVAYEGGGVWSDYGSNGGIVMVSPPEFHYNTVTLTLPLTTINGNSTVAGNGNIDIAVTSDNKPYVLFPNESTNRSNPVTDYDEILIYIKSDYYKGWASYINSMPNTVTVLDDENKTVITQFTTEPPMGTYPLKRKLKVGRIDPEPAEPVYDFYYYLDGDGSQGLQSMKSNLIATSGTRTLTYNFQKKNGHYPIKITSVTYEDTNSGIDYMEEWEGIGEYTINGKNDGENATVDLLNESFMMRYISDYQDFSWGPSGPIKELPDVEIYNNDENYSINDITQHYMKLITEEGPVFFYLDNGNQDNIDYDASTVTINYKGLGNFITYLHITQNELDVTVE
ncbi:hypothetical protein J7W08_07475 [Methanococcoides orientis]|uniref:DUF7289 family protein n=1 Tax=Methanococcoides orientis TaxID=2822137 RepID=UPI001E5F73DD|nr:hypothetical protein [Methanococcoides orientis]UGV41933.1 hypothetical protein J7W08_07475 [Methanococcoides orientis]